MIEIKESGEQLTERDIHEFESSLGYPLPEGFRNFLMRHNGGRPTPDSFHISEKYGESSVHFFFGLGPTAPHEELSSARRCFEGRIPSELLPIGCDPLGNQICLAIKGCGLGNVFFWNHDQEHKPPTYANIAFLSIDFTSFIDGLYQFSPAWETPIDIAIQNDDVTALEKLLEEGADLEEKDQFGRSMLENASIQNSIHVFEWLYMRGARLGNSLDLAQENARFFPEHARMVHLIQHLMQKQ